MDQASEASWRNPEEVMFGYSCHGPRPMTTQALVAERVFKPTLALCNHDLTMLNHINSINKQLE